MDIEIADRFGRPCHPKDGFVAPLFVIDEAVERIEDRTIVDYPFDPKTMAVVKT